MVHITILAVGRLKERYWREAVDEYVKRLGRFGKAQVVEVPDEPAPERLSPAQERLVMEKEGRRLLEKIPPDAFVMTLEVEGKRLTSPGLSQLLAQKQVEGKSRFVFVIGGSLGLAPEVRRRGDFALSLSDLTLPHQLARVLLAEQIYRSFKLQTGEPYHK